jgi:hypothetical protein
MAIFNIKNLRKDSGTPVTYVVGANVETRVYYPEEFYALEADSLTYESQKLITTGILALVQPPVVSVLNMLPYNGLPLIFGGDWVTDQYYESGWVLDYGGTYFVVTTDHTSSSNPSVDTDNYDFFSIPSVSSFFGLTLGSINDDELIIRTSLGWTSGLINDANVNELSVSKITGLQTSLDNKIGNGDTLTDFIVLHANPTAAYHPTTKQYVDDGFVQKSGAVLTGGGHISDPVAPATLDHLTRKGYVDTEVLKKLSLTGGSMTGYLTLHAAPVSNFHAANKKWVDDTFLKLSGGSITGNVAFGSGALTLAADPTTSLHAVTKQYVDNKSSFLAATVTFADAISVTGTASAASLVSSGESTLDSLVVTNGASLGGLSLNSNVITDVANPVLDTDAANKQWSVATFLSLAGGTMTGDLTLAGAPTEDLHPATKLYVDGLTSGGAGLPLSGGTMTGNLDMDGNIIIDPVVSNATFTGAVVLGKEATDLTGLYEDSDNLQPTYKDRRLSTKSKAVTVYADYTVGDDVSHVQVEAETGFVVITLPSTYTTNYTAASDDGGGNALFVVADSSNFHIGQHVSVTGYYQEETTIIDITDSTHITVGIVFDIDATGSISSLGVSNPSDITVEKVNGIHPVIVAPSDWSTGSGVYTSLDRKGESVTLSPSLDAVDRFTSKYVVVNRVSPPLKNLTAGLTTTVVAANTESYSVVADNGDDTIRITIADSSGFHVGDPVVLTGDYAATSKVNFIPDSTHLDIDIPFVATGTGTVETKVATLTGTIKKWETKYYNVTAVTNNAPNSNFNVGSNTNFRVGDVVTLYGPTYDGRATVLAKVSTNVVTLATPYVGDGPDTVVEINEQTSLVGDPRKIILALSDDRAVPLGGGVANISSAGVGSVLASTANKAIVMTDKDGDFECRVSGNGATVWAFASSAGYLQGEFQPVVENEVTSIEILSTAITSVVDNGGTARLNVSDSSGFRTGDTITIAGTGGVYDGEWVISAVPTSGTVDLTTAFISTATGVVSGADSVGNDIIFVKTKSTDFFAANDAVGVKMSSIETSPFGNTHPSNVYYGVIRDVLTGRGFTLSEEFIALGATQGTAFINSSKVIDFS